MDLPLRNFFVLTVLLTFCLVTALSGLTVWGCTAFRRFLLPDSNAAYLTIEQTFANGTTAQSTHFFNYGTEMQDIPLLIMDNPDEDAILDSKYSIQKIENSFDMLTPKRKLAYQCSGIAMIVVPAVLSVVGILTCGFQFYRRKLSEPLRLLSHAMERIAAQDLDFSVEYPCKDEMGTLCCSFEQMRQALYENGKAMWDLLEERRLLQASIAHDLRNPIAIVEGYTEYLQLNLPAGKLDRESTERILNNLNMAAKRLEHYTESVRTLNQLEDMKVQKAEISTLRLVEDIREDSRIMLDKQGIGLTVENTMPDCHIQIDIAVLCRILENILGNAARFAQSTVSIRFSLDKRQMRVLVTDDGSGFPTEILAKKERLFLPTQEEGHIGMGLAISRLLCKRHGGSLKLSNNVPHGAAVEIILEV